MRIVLVATFLVLASLVPVAAATEAAPCTPPVSQWGVCYQDGCAIVDGPAIHEEYCVVVAGPAFCTVQLGQWQACVDWPCVILDGPAFHEVYCVKRA